MKILLVATKAPWPPSDGGRLLVRNTLEGLAAGGHRVTLVAPVGAGGDRRTLGEQLGAWCAPCLVDSRPRSFLRSILTSRIHGIPLSIARHALPRVRREVARQLAAGDFDVVHVEQLQALAQAEPATARGLPVVLRAQNVESDLWAAAGRRRLGSFLRREAARLAKLEGAAIRRTTATVALTRDDAQRLSLLAGGAAVEVVTVPFPARLPAADGPLAGSPPVVHLGSAGWLPNRDSARWLVEAIWPEVRRSLPGARLHVFGHFPGGSPAGLTAHPPPRDSRTAFAPGAVLVVPLRIGSGIRMKILEAWARGVPTVATPTAVAGLEAADGREVLVASDPRDFARALGRLWNEPALRASLVAGGRARLAEFHDPGKIGRDLAAVYEEARRRTVAAADAAPRRLATASENASVSS